MASRRDELNAYNFARKRTVASFLKPLPNGSVESAPRPLRTVLPSMILGMVIVAGFGACGIIKPTAPKGWDKPGEKVIVGDQSTTRYVVLSGEKDENGKPTKFLHPVLNLASARLLLDPEKFEVVKVKESELDNGQVPMGPTIGIPYAPDRLPSVEDARTKKVWALCERPGNNEGGDPEHAVFVLNKEDEGRRKLVEGRNRLNERRSLYVKDPKGVEYLVDHRGVAHRLHATYGLERQGQSVSAQKRVEQEGLLRRILFGQGAEPQRVTKEFMDTLIESPLPIFLPPLANAGSPSRAKGVPQEHRIVGKVLETSDDGGTQAYVVLEDRLAPVTDFVAEMLLEGPVGYEVNGGRTVEPVRVPQASVVPDKEWYLGEFGGRKSPWPEERSTRANEVENPEGNHVVCSVYHGGERELYGQSLKVPELSVWAGKVYPATTTEAGRNTYVSPGSGLLYRQVTATGKSGALFLVTDTGLRYSVPVNTDTSDKAGKKDDKRNEAQIRLGYGDISQPPTVPKQWSELLSAGPVLSTEAARQPQGA